ncbi:FG-GAP-like repeat-containing protein [Paraflavitalea pollutisoli]|uniref:FG-GAP-like repeat-containing protein n=1 Tax=Paraflavitalea pollutisoli TaxID=3034143 RepID=UPI0023ECD50A|nr:FG-GAP-like repeat-containing protein [Paraflavitalea sp. H1-2-19X]
MALLLTGLLFLLNIQPSIARQGSVDPDYRPIITNISPANGPAGTVVTITGSHFSAVYDTEQPIVYFGAVRAAVTQWTSNSITVIAPAGATYQPVIVSGGFNVAISPRPFVLTHSGGDALITRQTFGPKTQIDLPAPARAGIIQDIDDDGKPDFVFGDYNNAGIKVYHNTTTTAVANFTAGNTYPIGNRPYHMVAGDMDGNGLPDLPTVNQLSKTITIWRNAGPGQPYPPFDGSRLVGTGPQPAAVVLADLNVDGRPDLAVVNTDSNSLSLYPSTMIYGALTFGARASLATGSSPSFVAASDLDNDGKTDLVVANGNSNSVSVYRNTVVALGETCQFATPVDYTTATAPVHIAIGDLDGDGKPDLLVTNAGQGSVTILKNTSMPGNVSFVAQTSLQLGTAGLGVSAVIGDLNGDARVDVAISYDSLTYGRLAVYTNTSTFGSISFGTPAILEISANATILHIGDVNGDAQPDLVAGGMGHNSIAIYHSIPTLGPIVRKAAPLNAGKGTEVRLVGANLNGATAVSFGGLPAASFTVVSDTVITAIVGSGNTGTISVTTPEGSASVPGFRFYGKPILSSFAPQQAATGDTVIIKGNYLDGVTHVAFGGHASPSFLPGADSIIAIVGSGGSGALTVAGYGGRDTLAGFTYILPPAITSFSPESGKHGDLITIRGNNLQSVTSVYLGSHKASITGTLTDTLITVAVQGGDWGPVKVTTPGGTAVKPGFRYTEPYIYNLINPTEPSPGGQVAIHGYNLTGVNSVRFGNYPAVAFTILSDSMIVATLDLQAESPCKISGPHGQDSVAVTFQLQPLIRSITPLAGPVGTTVTITGSNFDPVAANNTVFVGAVKAPVTTASNNQLTITIPVGATYHPITVTTNKWTARSLQMFNTTFAGADTLSVSAFAYPLKVNVPRTAQSLRLKEMNGDGKADIIGVDAAGLANSISIHRRIDAVDSIAFGPIATFQTPIQTYQLEVGDLDGDGKPDVAVTSSAGLSVFRNTSIGDTITLAPRMDLPTNAQPFGITIVDVSNDGKPDIVVANSGTTLVSVYKNISTPGFLAFEAKTDIPVGQTPYAVAGGDIDGDGKADIVVSNLASGTISVLRNTGSRGSIQFQLSQFTAASGIRDIVLADLDSDGKPDVAGNTSATGYVIVVMKNTSIPGLVTFDTPLLVGPRSSTSTSYALTAGDLNGDGKIDLALAGHFQGRLTLLRNTTANGVLSFNQTVHISGYVETPAGVVIGDLDGDQRPEITVGNSLSTLGIGILKNRSGLPLTTIHSFAPAAAATGDSVTIRGTLLGRTKEVTFGSGYKAAFVIKSDTLIRAAVPNNAASGTIRVGTLEGIGFAAGFVYTGPTITGITPLKGGRGTVVTITGKRFTGATAVTLGNDPMQSFEVISDSVIKAIVDTGGLAFIYVTTPAGKAMATSYFQYITRLSILDFAPRLAAAGSTITISGTEFQPVADSNIVYFGGVRGTVTSATKTTLQVIVPPGAGNQRLSVTTQGRTVVSSAYFGTWWAGGEVGFSGNSFAPPVTTTTGGKPIGASLADLDNDGKQDLVLIHDKTTGALEVYRNTSNADTLLLQPKQVLNSKRSLSDIAVADLDGDGKPDIAVSSKDQSGFSLYRNTSTPGSISFDTAIHYNTSYGTSLIAVADLDNNGKPEVAVYEPTSGKLYIYHNESSRAQFSFVNSTTLTYTEKIIDLQLVDIQNDYLPDIVALFESGVNGRVQVYPNASSGSTLSFSTPFNIVTNGSPFRLLVNELNRDDQPDAVTISNGYKTITTYEGAGLTFISATQHHASTPDLSGLAVADLNGDGLPEVISTRLNVQQIDIRRNQSVPNGRIELAPAIGYPIAQSGTNVYAADLDGDGRPDLLTIHANNGSIALLKNLVGNATLIPSGARPVNGKLTQQVTVAPEVPTLNGTPYVQRSYELTAAGSQPGATATVTFYFTQDEFDQYNDHPNRSASLPDSASDDAGKANLRIYQYIPTTGAKAGEVLADSVIVINPDDANIVWNETAGCWQITVPVEGLNRFMVSAVGFVYKQIAGPAITVTGSTEVCEGTSVTLTAAVTTGNQWYKDNNAIAGATEHFYKATTSGNYTVTAVVQEVRTLPSAAKTIKVNAIPARPVITANGQELVSSAATGNQWYREGVAINGATTSVYKPTEAGNYSVTTTQSGCTSVQSASAHFTITGIINIDNTQYVSLNPNPVDDYLLFNFNVTGTTKLNIRIVDLQGKVVKTFLNQTSGSRLYLAHLTPGIYLVKITGANNKINYTMKVLKR